MGREGLPANDSDATRLCMTVTLSEGRFSASREAGEGGPRGWGGRACRRDHKVVHKNLSLPRGPGMSSSPRSFI